MSESSTAMSQSANPPKPNDEQLKYLVAEHESLTNEKQAILSQINKDRLFGITATGAIWAWFTTNHEIFSDADAWMKSMLLLPTMLVLFLFILRMLHGIAVSQVGNYVRLVEKSILPPELGWESWLQKNRTEKYGYDKGYWIILFLTNCGLAALAYCYW